MQSNIEAFLEAWPRFQEGIVTTIYLTLGGAALGFAMALVLGVAAGSRLMVIRGAVSYTYLTLPTNREV